jgi:pyridoxal phosphate enzyme (YggS family)
MASGLSDVLTRIAAAADRAGRDPGAITLVAVSKTATREGLRAAYDAGVRDFGENRADQLAERTTWLPPDARWHMVGRVQGNKVRLVRPVVSLLHSLDRPDLAGYWVKGPGMPPPVLVQVNIGRERQKGGVLPDAAGDLVEHAVDLGLEVTGLMAIPPVAADPEAVRPYFAALRELRDRISGRHPSIRHLSMGMTDDFEVAISEGATILRVGRAIFRPTTGEE